MYCDYRKPGNNPCRNVCKVKAKMISISSKMLRIIKLKKTGIPWERPAALVSLCFTYDVRGRILLLLKWF